MSHFLSQTTVAAVLFSLSNKDVARAQYLVSKTHECSSTALHQFDDGAFRRCGCAGRSICQVCWFLHVISQHAQHVKVRVGSAVVEGSSLFVAQQNIASV